MDKKKGTPRDNRPLIILMNQDILKKMLRKKLL